MKLYTVWSGEYSDRCLHKIFQSKEKAQKYVEVCNQLYDGYGDFYMCEYELADEKFNINTQVNKYYFASIICTPYDETDAEVKAGDIETDWMWKELMEDLEIKDFSELDPKLYLPKLNKIGRDETNYNLSITNDIDSREFIINKITKYNDPNVIQNITVYTTHGYHIARKIAIEQYQIWQQKQLVDGYFSSENIPLESIDDKFYLPGDDI